MKCVSIQDFHWGTLTVNGLILIDLPSSGGLAASSCPMNNCYLVISLFHSGASETCVYLITSNADSQTYAFYTALYSVL